MAVEIALISVLKVVKSQASDATDCYLTKESVKQELDFRRRKNAHNRVRYEWFPLAFLARCLFLVYDMSPKRSLGL